MGVPPLFNHFIMTAQKKQTETGNEVSYDETIRRDLKQRRISATSNRIKVLATVYLLKRNISTGAVLKTINYSIERTSVHRALRLFCKKGLLMLVPNINGVIEYDLAGQPHTNQLTIQASFICLQCGKHSQVMVTNDTFRHANPICVQEIVLKGLCEQCGQTGIA